MTTTPGPLRIRIAMLGIAEGVIAATADEVQAGVRLPWVELDGHRFEHIVAATFEATDDGFATCRLILELIGRVELVYVDGNGDPLPGAAIDVEDPCALGRLDHEIARERL